MKRIANRAKSRESNSDKEQTSFFGLSRSASSEDLTQYNSVSSADVFANFNPSKPNKFLEDALINRDFASLYAGLQHGMRTDENFKAYGRTIINILGNPILEATPQQERQVFLHLKAFTIMNSLSDPSYFPRSKKDFDCMLISSIEKCSSIKMQFDESEIQDICYIINDQFYTLSGMMYLLSADIMSKTISEKSSAEVMHGIYKLHCNRTNISDLFNDQAFRDSKIPGTHYAYGPILDYIQRVQKTVTYSYEDMDIIGSRSSASYSFI